MSNKFDLKTIKRGKKRGEEGGGPVFSRNRRISPIEEEPEPPVAQRNRQQERRYISRNIASNEQQQNYLQAEINRLGQRPINPQREEGESHQDYIDRRGELLHAQDMLENKERYIRMPYAKKEKHAQAYLKQAQDKREMNKEERRENRKREGKGYGSQSDSESDSESDIEGGMFRNLYHTALQGGRISTANLRGLLNRSYEKIPENYLEYEVDKEMSGQRVQVYKNKNTGEVVVAHRGTQGIHDLGNDLKYALGFDLKNTERFKHAQDIQRKAEAKYGAEKITTIGHSIGSKIARDVGQNSKEVIELNPSYNIPDITKPKSDKTYTIRTQFDPVSFLVPLFKKMDRTTTIESKTVNPIVEHTVDVLDRIDPENQVGSGLKKKSIKELKAIAKRLPKQQRIKLTKVKKGDLLGHLCKCGGSL